VWRWLAAVDRPHHCTHTPSCVSCVPSLWKMRVLQLVREAVSDGPASGLSTDADERTASALLRQFLFPPARWHTPVSKLSGGECRRLQRASEASYHTRRAVVACARHRCGPDSYPSPCRSAPYPRVAAERVSRQFQRLRRMLLTSHACAAPDEPPRHSRRCHRHTIHRCCCSTSRRTTWTSTRLASLRASCRALAACSSS
jgi:hypothetical protein